MIMPVISVTGKRRFSAQAELSEKPRLHIPKMVIYVCD